MLDTVTGQIATPSENSQILEHRIALSQFGHHQGVEIYEIGVGAAREIVLYAVRVMAGRAGGPCGQMAAVTSPSGGPFFKTVVVQDAGPVMTAIAQAVILIAFRGVLQYLITPLQNWSIGRAMGPVRPRVVTVTVGAVDYAR